MNLAIFPGTFNPLHIGHLMIAESALQEFKLDKIHFILSPNPPHKVKDLIDVKHRKEILEVGIANNKKFTLDLREINRQGLSFTIDTVKEFKEENKIKNKLGMILGLDSFLTVESWQGSKELAQECKFFIAPRSGWDITDIEDSFPSFYHELEWHMIDSPMLPVSSSLIRQRKRNNQSYRYLLSDLCFEIYEKI